jgi:hypothetical protein
MLSCEFPYDIGNLDNLIPQPSKNLKSTLINRWEDALARKNKLGYTRTDDNFKLLGNRNEPQSE